MSLCVNRGNVESLRLETTLASCETVTTPDSMYHSGLIPSINAALLCCQRTKYVHEACMSDGLQHLVKLTVGEALALLDCTRRPVLSPVWP